jgi:hypothetical protein
MKRGKLLVLENYNAVHSCLCSLLTHTEEPTQTLNPSKAM